MKYSLSAVAVLHLDPLHRPAEFRGNNVAAAHRNTVAAFPQGLDAVELGVRDLDMIGIPQSRAAQVRSFRNRGFPVRDHARKDSAD